MEFLGDQTFSPPDSAGAGFSSGPTVDVPVTASPMTYTANGREALYISGGTLTLLQYQRGPVVLGLSLDLLNALIELNRGDRVIITYAVAPTQITCVPR